MVGTGTKSTSPPALATPAVQAYLQRTVRTWLGVPANASAAVPPLPEPLARVLLRCEEYETQHRDQWGCWEYGMSENFRSGRLWSPDVDSWVKEVERGLSAELQLEPRWPNGHRFVLCLTHDVDMMTRRWSPRQALRSLRLAATGSGNVDGGEAIARVAATVRAVGRQVRWRPSLRPSTAETLERCVEIERGRGVPGSYFFTAYPPGSPSYYDCSYAPADTCVFGGRKRTVASIMRELHDEGFDVGLHGSYFSATTSGLLERQRELLSSAADVPITTTRQHWLHWAIRTTPRLQVRAGFEADTTLGFNRNVGFRAGTSLPFFQFDLVEGEQLDLLEIPLVIQESGVFASNALELDRTMAQSVTKQVIDVIADVGGVATFLIHPHSLLNDDVAFLHEWALDYALERNAWVASVRDINEWWRNRASRLEEGREGSHRSDPCRV